MFIKKYLGKNKIELLKQKIKLLMDIELKLFPCLLIFKDQLKNMEAAKKQSPIIIIMIKKKQIQKSYIY